MKKSISTTLKAGVAALVLVAGSGCVSQKQVDEIKATADKAVQDAAAAKAAADSAASAAASARSPADSSDQPGLLRRDQREDRSRVQEGRIEVIDPVA